MKKFLEMLTEEMQQAFTAAGYDGSLGKVMLSNRPDLCEYQCNGAMAGAKLYKKAPIMIANDVAEQLKDSKVFSEGNFRGGRRRTSTRPRSSRPCSRISSSRWDAPAC